MEWPWYALSYYPIQGIERGGTKGPHRVAQLGIPRGRVSGEAGAL